MKTLICEMCSSADLLKQDGVYVCQHCGTKYSVEEARKMMIEGTVEVQGTVKIDRQDELEKLYIAARNAMEASDDKSAVNFYESIYAKDPTSWEALFYLVVLKTNSIKNGEIASAAISISNSLPKVFELISEHLEEEDAKEAVREVVEQCYDTAKWLTSASHNFYSSVTKGNGMMALTGVVGALSSLSSTNEALTEDSNRCCAIANIMCYCGNYTEQYFDMNDEDYRTYAVWSWKKMLQLHTEYREFHSKTKADLFDKESVDRFTKKIRQYDPSYGNSTTEQSGGCYVATAVYGSYDCPQVWTLRRFRDDTLAATWYGRLFIRTYYAVSPTLVKWFGETKWFKNLWRGKLDRMVNSLQAKGVESTPYEDRRW